MGGATARYPCLDLAQTQGFYQQAQSLGLPLWVAEFALPQRGRRLERSGLLMQRPPDGLQKLLSELGESLGATWSFEALENGC